MIVRYTVEHYLKDNIELYVKAKEYVDNYASIFVKRAKKLYPHFKKEFFRRVPKTDKDFYTDYVTDEHFLGVDQIEFVCDLNAAEDFCKTVRYLINYSGIKFESLNDGITITHIDNTKFYKSSIELSENDLKNIRRCKLFIDKYFE